MPSQVRMPRYVAQRNSSGWDEIVAAVVGAGKLGEENSYYGIETEERAREVYRKLRTAAGNAGLGRKVFWYGCNGCADGGSSCRYHVSFTLYDLAVARAYKEQQGRTRTQ